jgi:hypothetical protein
VVGSLLSARLQHADGGENSQGDTRGKRRLVSQRLLSTPLRSLSFLLSLRFSVSVNRRQLFLCGTILVFVPGKYVSKYDPGHRVIEDIFHNF